MSTEKVTGPRSYYPVFVPMSVYDNVHEEYYELIEGQLAIKSDVVLSGKITLPTSINGMPVLAVAPSGFENGAGNKDTSKITHIFWAKENRKVTNIYDNAFMYCRNMEYFEMPETVTEIGSYAFSTCEKLFSGDYGKKDSNNYAVEDFFKNIQSIGQFAMLNTSITDLVISNKTTYIGRRAFRSITSLLRNSALKTVQIGNQADNGSQLNLDMCGTEIFSNNDGSIESMICYFASDTTYDNFVNSYCFASGEVTPLTMQNAWGK